MSQHSTTIGEHYSVCFAGFDMVNSNIVIVSHFLLMRNVFLFLGEVLSEDSERADGSQAEHNQQQGTHPLH